MVVFNSDEYCDVEWRIQDSVNNALKQVQSILDHTRHPRLAEHEDHTYADKFALAEFVTNAAVAAQIKALERLGLNGEKFQTISNWVHSDQKSVTLRFEASDSCRFIKERVVDVVTSSPELQTTTTSETTPPSTATSHTSQSQVETTNVQVVTKVMEFHWKVEVSYRLLVFPGTDTSAAVELLSRSTSTFLITSGGQAVGEVLSFGSSAVSCEPPTPIPESTQHSPFDVNITWFFQQVEPNRRICQFQIDRNSEKAQKTCKTPRRNENVNAAHDFFECLSEWAHEVLSYMASHVEDKIANAHSPAQQNVVVVAGSPETVELPVGSRCLIAGMEINSSLNGQAVTVKEYLSEVLLFRVEYVEKNDDDEAALPLLIKPENLILDGVSQTPTLGSSVSTESLFCPILPLMENGAVFGNVGDLLQEQCRSLDEAISGLTKIFPSPKLGKLVSAAEATLFLIIYHLQDICVSYFGSVDYIERMLHTQLVQAIGKEICPSDFDQFMVFHNAKIFGANFAPSPFTYSVRRPGHCPDGTFTIECTRERSSEPIHSMVRRVPSDSVTSMFMPISAATAVELKGDRFLHGWMLHEFKSAAGHESYEFIARARQFSSFLVVIGTLEGPNKFLPKDAIILQNKDEVLIPLLMSTLPSAKEFKDSIASLSPEQQAFAQSYRNMQLESSVFGLCVIQLKPQLEKLLGLPDGALTKEIELTQNLMSLFVEYQIPSDLLACGGLQDSHTAAKISAVKGYVKSILDVIESSKLKQLSDEKDGANMSAIWMDSLSRTKLLVQGSCHLMGSCSLASVESSSRDFSHAMRRNSFTTSQESSPAVPFQQGDNATTPVETATPFHGEDFTLIPKLLDAKLEKSNVNDTLRSTVIEAGSKWTLNRQENLVTSLEEKRLYDEDIKSERTKAFDLLDAISRSGDLPIDSCEVHVIIAVSHCFENDVMETIIQDNVNPIEQVDRSSLVLASVIYNQSPSSLLNDCNYSQHLTMNRSSLARASGTDTQLETVANQERLI